MKTSIDFSSELPSGQALLVEADVLPGLPARVNCLPEDATPGEPTEAEITRVYLVDMDDTSKMTRIDLDDLFVKKRHMMAGAELFLDLLESEAIEHFEEGWG